jgi:hypothetical protein
MCSEMISVGSKWVSPARHHEPQVQQAAAQLSHKVARSYSGRRKLTGGKAKRQLQEYEAPTGILALTGRN